MWNLGPIAGDTKNDRDNLAAGAGTRLYTLTLITSEILDIGRFFMSKLRTFFLKLYENIGIKIGYLKLGSIRNFFNHHQKSIIFVHTNEIVHRDSIYNKITSKEEYDRMLSIHDKTVLSEDFIAKCNSRVVKKIIIDGKCGVCGSPYGFMATKDINIAPSSRELLGCVSCRRVRRERVILEKIKEYYNSGKTKIYMYETGSNLELVRKFAPDAVGSEFISADLKSGELVNGILHEDAHNLSFGNESFDIVVSRDVFEHINDPRQCLKEAFRVLKWGGYCIITIPWYPNIEKSHQRARFMNGKLELLDEPAYHWNPVSSSRDSLVFWDYGWDFIDFMKDAGFKEAYVQTYYDSEKGYLGDIGTYFVGEKAK